MKDIYAAGSSKPQSLTAVGNMLLFWANTAPNTGNYELYRSDGTAAGTSLVKDINPAGSSAYNLSYGVTSTPILDGVMYFIADDNVHGRELWRSDGTGACFRLVLRAEA